MNKITNQDSKFATYLVSCKILHEGSGSVQGEEQTTNHHHLTV